MRFHCVLVVLASVLAVANTSPVATGSDEVLIARGPLEQARAAEPRGETDWKRGGGGDWKRGGGGDWKRGGTDWKPRELERRGGTDWRPREEERRGGGDW